MNLRGIEIGKLHLYLRAPIQLWWGNRLLVHLRWGLRNG